MYTFVVIIHIIVCILLVLSVLLQKGKGAEIGAVFGSSEALFGSTGPITFLNKLTSVVAVVFMITSLALTYLSAHKGTGSIMEEVTTPPPATTAPAPQAPSGMPASQPQAPVKDATKAEAEAPSPKTDAAGAKEASPQQNKK